MNFIMDLLMRQFAGPLVSQISRKIGADEDTTRKAISVAVPLLIAALARNSSQPKGAEALHRALNKDHDGGILDNPMGLLANPQPAKGAGILRHTLGGRRNTVEKRIAQGTGLNADATGQLLEIIAPMVMGTLGRTQRQQGFDANRLSEFLGGQRQEAQASRPDIMGVLGNLLDANDDDSIADDIGRITGKLFDRR